MRLATRIAAGVVAAAVCAGAAGQSAAPAQPKDLIVSVEFEGGTIGEYVKAIKEAHPEANVVVTPEAALIPMPEVSIHGASLGAALQIAMTRGPTMPGTPGVIVDLDRAGGEGLPVYKLIARSVLPGETRSTVISLAPVIDAGVLEEDALAAMQAGLELFPTRATLRFHEDTSLLLVRGSEEQLRLLELIAKRLQDDAAAKRSSSPAQLDAEIEEARSLLAARERALLDRQRGKDQARAEYEKLSGELYSGKTVDSLYLDEAKRNYLRAGEAISEASEDVEEARLLVEMLTNRRRALPEDEKQ